MRIQRGPDGFPLENHKSIGFLSNAGPDSLKSYKATERAFNVGPSSARQRNAFKMAFCWRADDGRLKVLFGFKQKAEEKSFIQPRRK